MEELTIEYQNKLITMLQAEDLEIQSLALNIISSSQRPAVFVNFTTEYGTTYPFYIVVRHVSRYYLDILNNQRYSKEEKRKIFAQNNKDLLIKLSKY